MERTPRRDSLNPDDDDQRDSVDLLGYLLGSVDPEEAADIAARLERDPALQAKADQLYDSLPRPDAYWATELPPPGLADRTLAGLESLLDSGKIPGVGACGGRVPVGSEALQSSAQALNESQQADSTLSAAPGSLAAASGLGLVASLGPAPNLVEQRSWRFAEWFVGLASVTLMACLVLQALVNSRHQARLAHCQDNLRTLGRALASYAITHRDHLPQGKVGTPLGVAGAYASLLADQKLIDDSDVLCPSTERAASRSAFRIPHPFELERLSATALAYAQSTMGGDYGFTLGYQVDGVLQELMTDGSPFRVVMADLPGSQGASHAGRVINVLFDDGHWAAFHQPANPLLDDSFFVNRIGEVAPGLDPDDSVIAPSAVSRLQ